MRMRALQRPELGDAFHDADQPALARRVAADAAGIGGVEVAADRAGLHRGGGGAQRIGQRQHLRLGLHQHAQHGAPRAAPAETRQLRQQADQVLDRVARVHQPAGRVQGLPGGAAPGTPCPAAPKGRSRTAVPEALTISMLPLLPTVS